MSKNQWRIYTRNKSKYGNLWRNKRCQSGPMVPLPLLGAPLRVRLWPIVHQMKAEYAQLWFPDFWVRTRRSRNQVSAGGRENRHLGLQYSQFSSVLLLGKKCSNIMRNNHCLISSNGPSVSAIKCQVNAFNCCSIILHTLR